MTIEANTDGFTAAEEAFFASGGESDPTGAAPAAGADAGGAGDGATAPAAPAAGEAAPAAGAPKAGDTVPLARFLDEKKNRKALETQVAELRGKFSIIEKLQGGGDQQQQQAPAAPPKAEDDIFGAVKHVGETVEQMQKRLDEADAATKAQNEQTTFVNNYRADADKFQSANPDYRDAYNFVLNARAAELMAIGYDNPADPTLTPDEKHAAAKALHDALVADEYGIAEMAFKKNKSPAEILYGLAKQRGYTKKAAAPAPGAGEVTPGDAEPSKGAETLDRIERGQAANKSLSTTGGASGDPGMTAERLLAMPIDEFETWCNKNPAAAKRIMGG